MGQRAIIIGSGFVGLVTARVLADRFDQIILVERGQLPQTPAPRRQIPQGQQAHVLLARGAEVLYSLFPTLPAQLDEMGYAAQDMGTALTQFIGPTQLAKQPMGTLFRAVSRPLLQWCISRMVLALDNVTLREGCRVRGIEIEDGTATSITLASGETLTADLIVDATGRRSRLPVWLEEAGYGPLPVRKVDAGFGYASAVFRFPESARGGDHFFFAAQQPDHPLTALVVRYPDNTGIATLVGPAGMHPTTDPTGFVNLFERLPSPKVYALLRDSEMLGSVVPYTTTGNVHRQYGSLKRWPSQLVALGDSVCALNPRFGQGMTVASMGATLLGEHLDQFGTDTKRFQRRLDRMLSTPWAMATADDANWMSEQSAGIQQRLSQWYFKNLIDLSTHHFDVHTRVMRVAQMLDAPTTLFTPQIAAQVIWNGMRRTTPQRVA